MKDLHIVVVDLDRDRALMIVDGLRDAGHERISVVGDTVGLARRLSDLRPDIVLIDLENPNRDILTEIATAATPDERPVAMFVDRSDTAMMTAAVEAGVSAYVVDGLRKDR
ncbi:MAG: two-component system response regulator, partial [Pseudomonadota bacterium]